MESEISVGDQNSQQTIQNPINKPPQIREKPRFNYWIILALILAVLFLGILGAGLDLAPTQTPLSSQPACSQESDCVIGIQVTSCCSCPKAVNKELIGTEDWQLYETGKDYSSQQSESCGGTVACKPCELPKKPICQSGQCRFPDTISQ